MLVRQAFRYELAPTANQRAALANHAGAARWAWNWGLDIRRKAWRRRGERLNAIDLHRLLNRLKRLPRYGWLYEVSKCAPQEALRDLDVPTPTPGMAEELAVGSGFRGSRRRVHAPSGFG
jgi:putative transposase